MYTPKSQYTQCYLCEAPIGQEPTRRYLGMQLHEKCYQDWSTNHNNFTTDATDSYWWLALLDILHANGYADSRPKAHAQWKHYRQNGQYTAKGIYFTIRYFLNGGGKLTGGGIGIIPYVYEEAQQHWEAKARWAESITAGIQESQERVRNNPPQPIKFADPSHGNALGKSRFRRGTTLADLGPAQDTKE